MENEDMDLAEFCKFLNDGSYCMDIERRNCPIDKLFFEIQDNSNEFNYLIKKIEKE